MTEPLSPATDDVAADTASANAAAAPTAPAPSQGGDGDSQRATPPATPPAVPPRGLPEKFWDAERGELRAESLIKSYRSLEQKLGRLGGERVPDDPGGYDIHLAGDLIASDADVNERLHAAGFNQAQAQTVYDLAAEYMVPMVNDVAAEFHAQAQVERLVQHFGGEDKWRGTATQLKSWGLAKLPKEVFQALSSTYEGVLAMHRMMRSGEPGLIEGLGNAGEAQSEERLRAMMQDPRYWRDHDSTFIKQVESGFKRLYPDQGSN